MRTAWRRPAWRRGRAALSAEFVVVRWRVRIYSRRVYSRDVGCCCVEAKRVGVDEVAEGKSEAPNYVEISGRADDVNAERISAVSRPLNSGVVHWKGPAENGALGRTV